MLSKIKSLSRSGWIVVGFLAALILVPSGMAVANVLKYAGIEGTSTNKADVAPSGQLFITNAPPGKIFNTPLTEVIPSDDPLLTPPAGEDAIVTQISVDQLNLGSTQTQTPILWVGPSPCNGASPGYWQDGITRTGAGENELTFPDGVAVPTGDALCTYEATLGGTNTYATASGYFVPAGSVTAPNS